MSVRIILTFEQAAIYPSVRWIGGRWHKKARDGIATSGLVSRIEEEEENETLRRKLPRCSLPVCEILRTSERVADDRSVRVDVRQQKGRRRAGLVASFRSVYLIIILEDGQAVRIIADTRHGR